MLVIYGIMYWGGDKWWFATVLLYGPRWIYLLPMCVLFPLSLFGVRQSLFFLLFVGVFIVWKVLGFNFALSNSVDSDATGLLRVLTYNVNRWAVNAEEVSELIELVQPDLVAIQECASPRSLKISSDWYVKESGSSIVVSRYPILESRVLKRVYYPSGLYCIIDTPKGEIGFCCVDLLTPRRALTIVLDSKKIFNLDQVKAAEDKIAFRWIESEKLFKWVKGFGDAKILAGDFNLTIDSTIYRTYWRNYDNSFLKKGIGFGHTKKTKINIFKYTSKIDHILSTSDFRPVRTWIGPDFGSDHLPLIAEFEY
ncbi:endonuclease/exonuclease/phosphatase family protein [Desulfobacter latus]|uniref:Endonuclease/exonuclease/phosphatase family protein n=1 Tax=Desulfobacter latus TaxID=2292 RepID=A0A850SV72_9BACT|nr:endonuclease/exonuclease/phosphatase family protein [Desulfobacter latus]NWH05049.1 endonuclease/exonuclease/phosphatase family protein [Desulfobacter latus]